jgi:branched-chain amino acid transport system ATP-binding protein
MTAAAPPAPPVLELQDVSSGYGDTTVVRGVSMQVQPGTVVAILGPNGAGKTTLLRTCSGLLRASRGHVLLHGHDVSRLAPYRRGERGLCHIPEGRGIFRNLTVRDNLRMSLPPWAKHNSPEAAMDAFPILKQRASQTAGSLSGGEQQMLAVARAYLCNPTVVLLDEVSIGLAPLVIDRIYASLDILTQQGVALVLVEQYVHRALEICDTVYVVNHGTIRFHGTPDDLSHDTLASEYITGTM